MAIRVSGLVSGLDTDSIVQELVSAYSKKKDKHVKAQTKLEWKMDAWKELNKKVNSLYKRLGNMKLSSYYNKKTTTISDSTKATVTASGSALNGTQTLKINEVASTGYLTGGALSNTATANTTLGQLGMASGKGTVAVTTKNGTKNIEVSDDMKISDFLTKLRDAGVSANFDNTYKRLYITAKDSGVENDFSLTASDANGLEALKSLKIYTASDANKATYEKWDAYAVDVNGRTKYVMDVDGNFVLDSDGKKIDNPGFDASNIDANKTKDHFKKILDKITTYQGGSDVSGSIKELESKNAGLKTNLTNLQADQKYAVAYISMKTALAVEKDDGSGDTKLTEPEQAQVEALLKKKEEDLTEPEKAEIEHWKTELGYSDEEFAQLKANVQAVADFESDTANSAVTQAIHDAYAEPDPQDRQDRLQAWVDQNSADQKTVTDTMQANNDEIAEKQKFINDNAFLTQSAPAATLTEEQQNTMTALDIAKFREQDNANRADALLDKYLYVQNTLKNDNNYSQDAKRIDGSDAQIELNGVIYNSASNSITVNGITVTALQKTSPGETLTISTQTDVQGMYDTIKDFLKEYNALIKEMDELYNADSAKGYEPLTDDEKESMSDKEIEKWEEKIKGSILRRDDTLSTVMSLMTSTMAQGITLSDGKKYSLSTFGIKTQGYLAAAENEGYLYHIDGDSEDEVSSGNTDKLLAALQKDPDMVQEFFQKLSDDLYTKLDKKMQSSTMNSRFSIYNDKKMQSDYDNYTKTIKKWEEKVTSMEDYYYKKFSAMEKALSTLQQSTSALSGLLGS